MFNNNKYCRLSMVIQQQSTILLLLLTILLILILSRSAKTLKHKGNGYCNWCCISDYGPDETVGKKKCFSNWKHGFCCKVDKSDDNPFQIDLRIHNESNSTLNTSFTGNDPSTLTTTLPSSQSSNSIQGGTNEKAGGTSNIPSPFAPTYSSHPRGHTHTDTDTHTYTHEHDNKINKSSSSSPLTALIGGMTKLHTPNDFSNNPNSNGPTGFQFNNNNSIYANPYSNIQTPTTLLNATPINNSNTTNTLLGGMQIFVTTLAGETITLHVEPNDTIRNVKMKIFQKSQISIETQKLFNSKPVEDGIKFAINYNFDFDSRLLDDVRTLNSYKIQNESRIYLILKIPTKIDYNPWHDYKKTNKNTNIKNGFGSFYEQGCQGTIFICKSRSKSAEEIVLKECPIGTDRRKKDFYRSRDASNILVNQLSLHEYINLPLCFAIYNSCNQGPMGVEIQTLYPHGNLLQYMNQKGPMLNANTRNLKRYNFLITRMMKTVREIHEYDIAHRDLKAENWLITRNGLKLTDFGLCLKQDGNPLHANEVQFMGARVHMSPERLIGFIVTDEEPPIDLKDHDQWEITCNVIEIVIGRHNYDKFWQKWLGDKTLKNAFNTYENLACLVNKLLSYSNGYNEWNIVSQLLQYRNNGINNKSDEFDKILLFAENAKPAEANNLKERNIDYIINQILKPQKDQHYEHLINEYIGNKMKTIRKATLKSIKSELLQKASDLTKVFKKWLHPKIIEKEQINGWPDVVTDHVDKLTEQMERMTVDAPTGYGNTHGIQYSWESQRLRNITNTPPNNYICKNCNSIGKHWITNCKANVQDAKC